MNNKQMRSSYDVFMNAAGICIENRFVPLVESALNIFFSILLLKIFGLAGVFMGTIVSGLALWCFSYPKFLYKKLFNRSYLDYAKETILYLLLFIIVCVITYKITALIVLNNMFLQVAVNFILTAIISNIIVIVIFYKTDNFKYFVNLAKKFLKKHNA